MIRILQIIGSLNMGGAENLIVNLYKNIDRRVIQFDFLLYDKPQGKNYYDEVIKLGAQIYYVPSKKDGLIRNYKAIKEIVKLHRYSIVWKNTDNCFAGMDIIAAKHGRAQRCILHSHNTWGLRLQRELHYLTRPLVNVFTNSRWACGEAAGKWMFGNRKFIVVNNGIDLNYFCYREEIRNEYRETLGLQDKIVVGNIGRFEPQKNHSFMIDVFSEFCKKEEQAVLVLIGEGGLQEEIKGQARKRGIEDKVLFLNTRTDTAELLQMMDIFIMPSKFEGFGIALLEAQATGLPCIASDQVPDKVNVTGQVEYLSLEDAKQWADTLRAMKNRGSIDNATAMIREAGYSIQDIAKDIEAMILSIEEQV